MWPLSIRVKHLQALVTYVIKVYAPIWFHVKTQPLCSDGSRHLWRLIKYSRYLTPELREIVDPVIQKNGYFGHSENILLYRQACTTSDGQFLGRTNS